MIEDPLGISPGFEIYVAVRHYVFLTIFIVMSTAIPESYWNLREAYLYKNAYLKEYGTDPSADGEQAHEIRILIDRNVWKSWSHMMMVSLITLISLMVVTYRAQLAYGIPLYAVGAVTLTLTVIFSTILRWGIYSLRRDLQQFKRIREARIRREMEAARE